MSQGKLVWLAKAMDLNLNWPTLQLQQGPPKEISQCEKGKLKLRKEEQNPPSHLGL